MRKEVKEKWVSALLSGEYKQVSHTLRYSDNSFCVLGLLFHVAGVDWRRYHRTGCYSYMFSEAGLDKDAGHELVGMNSFYPFAVLANWILENIPVEED